MNRIAYLSLAVFLLVAMYLRAAESPPVPVAYSVTLELKKGMLTALGVEIRFNGNTDGMTRLHLPEEFAGQTGLWRQVADLTVEGAEVSEASPSVRILRHKPGAPIVVHYRVVPGMEKIPRAKGDCPTVPSFVPLGLVSWGR